MPSISHETELKLRAYCELLIKWQAKINLVSPATLNTAWTRHFKDSLQLLDHLPTGGRMYDLGSGAGFPGMVIAIARAELGVTLIESDSKKCAFLQTVSRETGAKVNIINARIEAVTATPPPPDVVTARALASLPDLLSYIGPWAASKPSLTALFPKGAGYQEEIIAAKKAGWTFDLQDFASETDPAARILRLQNLRKTNDKIESS